MAIQTDKKIFDPSWDFRNADTKYATHGLHIYPAMMIPHIAHRLIDSYGHEGDILLDPFCGSGTALVEARIAGLHSWGIDINPLALLLAKVKTTPIDPENLLTEFEHIKTTVNADLLALDLGKLDVEVPDFFNISYWFKPKVSKKLWIIKNAINEIQNDDIRDFFLVAFSETVRDSSNTRKGEFKLFRIPKDKLQTYEPDVWAIFQAKVQRNIEHMAQFFSCSRRDVWVRIISQDTRQHTEISSESVNLVVTSPPYGDSRTTVAYGQFSRLSLQWLGFDYKEISKIDTMSLGGMKVDVSACNLPSPLLSETLNLIAEKDYTRAQYVSSFYLDLHKCLIELARVLAVGGYLCIVIGNRSVKGVQIPTDDILVQLCEALGFVHEKTIIRNIPSKTMPLMTSPSNIPGERAATILRESVVILRKMQ